MQEEEVRTGTTRGRYLATSAVALDLLCRPELGEAWERPSVLAEFSIAALAGHLARSILQVEWYLDEQAPEGTPITAARYYAELDGTQDLDSSLNAGVRERSAQTATAGHEGITRQATETLDRLKHRLAREPVDRRLEAFHRVLSLDEYLRTRLIELVVHIEDLALSIGVEPPRVPEDARLDAIAVLVDASVERHGSAAVVRALTRRERDAVEALRVL